jgi:hypothetical protein
LRSSQHIAGADTSKHLAGPIGIDGSRRVRTYGIMCYLGVEVDDALEITEKIDV